MLWLLHTEVAFHRQQRMLVLWPHSTTCGTYVVMWWGEQVDIGLVKLLCVQLLELPALTVPKAQGCCCHDDNMPIWPAMRLMVFYVRCCC